MYSYAEESCEECGHTLTDCLCEYDEENEDDEDNED